MQSRSHRNPLAVVFSDFRGSTTTYINFKTKAAAAYKLCYELSQNSLEQLSDKFGVLVGQQAATTNFSTVLLDAVKEFPEKDFNSLFVVTTTSDPCGGFSDDSFAALGQFNSMRDWKMFFDVLPMSNHFDFELFYDEVFETLNVSKSYFYYDGESFSNKLLEKLEYNQHHNVLNLYLYLGSNLSMKELQSNLGTNLKLLETTISKTTREFVNVSYGPSEPELQPDGEKDKNVVVTEYRVFKDSAITAATQQLVSDTNIIPTGIVLIAARREAYRHPGFLMAPPSLIRPAKASISSFNKLWDAHKDLHLLCHLKARPNTRSYIAELRPVLVKDQRQFIISVMPHVHQVYIRDMDPYPEDLLPQEANDATRKGRADVMEQLITALSIQDFDPSLFRPLQPIKHIEYFKGEILGSTYTPRPVLDILKEVLYDENQAGPIARLIHDLERYSPEADVVQRRKRTKKN